MVTAGKIDIKSRLAGIRDTSTVRSPRFQRFPHPEASPKNRVQLSCVEHLKGKRILLSSQTTFTTAEFVSKIGDLSAVAEPVQVMRGFHEEQLLRIIDLFKNTQNPVLVADQVANLRQSLVIWSFRLAARENQGNLALLFGGSAANGVHTFLTDFDYVVMPHSQEDREAARRVQSLMVALICALGIEADTVMPINFNNATFNELEQRYDPYVRTKTDDLIEELKRKSSVSFFRFLMDVRLADVAQKEEAAPIGFDEYQQRLNHLKDRLIFSVPEHMLTICARSFEDKMNILPGKLGPEELYNIKTKPLRLFHYALYASRAKLGIKDSNFWEVIRQLHLNGLIGAEERIGATKALRLFVSLRHLLGIAITEALDSTKIDDRVLGELAGIVGEHGLSNEENRQLLIGTIEENRDELISLSIRIFERLGHQINS